MRENDAILEALIRAKIQRINTTDNPIIMRQHWREVVELIGRRSPEQIRKMELERGLSLDNLP